MLRKISTLAVILALGASYNATAKIWRINNNPGVIADFNSFFAAVGSASVQAGDTLHIESSATLYNTSSISLTKSLVVIGPGYFLDPADGTFPGNPGLQAVIKGASLAFFRFGPGSEGSKFIGVGLEQAVYLNGTSNIHFEKIYFGTAGIYFESGTNDNINIRKCFFHAGSSFSMSPTVTVTNVKIENNIFWGSYMNLDRLSGSENIFRNNSIANSGHGMTFSNTYVANNIFGNTGANTFVNCTIKNNLFAFNQVLPGTATNNQVSVNMTNVYVGGTSNSLDSRYVLKAGSPAIGAGLTIGAVVSPDCGAFGATDPYVLSGIPNIPSIYALTVPVSIPSGANTMNVTFSTRNNQ